MRSGRVTRRGPCSKETRRRALRGSRLGEEALLRTVRYDIHIKVTVSYVNGWIDPCSSSSVHVSEWLLP